MRRLARLGLAALATGALLLVLGMLAAGTYIPVGAKVASHVLANAGRLVVGRALAAEVLEFKTVPPESARVLDRKRTVRIKSTAAIPPVPAVPATPPVPAVPAVPATPETPDITIDVDGRSGDMMRIGQDIRIESGETVTGDVVAMGGDIVVDGHVEGDVQAMGGDVYLNSGSRVDGDVFCMGGQLHEEEGAQVGGQRVTALGPKGKRWQPHISLRDHEDRSEHRRSPVGVVIVTIIFTLLAWIPAVLAPGRSQAALDRLRREPGQSFLVGLLIALLWVPGFIAVAVVSAILCITLIGIPVAIALLLAYPLVLGLVGIWGWSVLAIAIGRRVSAGQPAPVSLGRAALYGGLVFGAVLMVAVLLNWMGPLAGLGGFVRALAWIAFGIGSLIGAGALVRHEFAEGMLGRWWSGRRPAGASFSSSVPPAPAPAPASAPVVEAPPPPPPPPASSYMPPDDTPPTS